MLLYAALDINKMLQIGYTPIHGMYYFLFCTYLRPRIGLHPIRGMIL